MKISLSLERLAKEVGGTVRGDGSLEIGGVAPLEAAKPGDLTFVTNHLYFKAAKSTRASALLCEKIIAGISKPFLLSPNPYAALAKIMNLFLPAPVRESGIQKGALVHPKAFVHSQAIVAAGVTISAGAKIGARSVLYPGVYIGEHSVVGDDCLIFPNVVLRENCVIGNRVILQPGVVIGADGFGFAKDGESYLKIPQVGNVVLEDDVELGANTCVDRASFGTTRIGKGTKLDNLIQIGHNVIIGKNGVIAALTGLAGSSRVGNQVVMGGQSGVGGHLKVGDNVTLAARSAVLQDIPEKGVYWGNPAINMMAEMRNSASYRQLPELIKRIRNLEKALEKLQGLKKNGK